MMRPNTGRVYIQRRRMIAALIAIGVLALIAAVVIGWVARSSTGSGAPRVTATPLSTVDGSPTPTPTPTPTAARQTPSPAPSPSSVSTFDRSAHSIDDPNSIWVVVDKVRPLNPQDFVPELVTVDVPHTYEPRLRPEAAVTYKEMFDAALTEGVHLESNSTYRSFSQQTQNYGDGSDPTTAKPGHSEHQTGLAADIGAANGKCAFEVCYGDTPEGKWLAANAWKYGWLLRYPADKVAVAGFPYEPWHYRYIGKELAAEMHRTGVTTLEEFFGLPPAPDYN
ncbi:MAG TPA: M15 family metallopeptidase [Candidatus Lumbricidophila sp.]|nr:M15 family metallopeptidase [Candidatus Lumbricidophila sp.]